MRAPPTVAVAPGVAVEAKHLESVGIVVQPKPIGDIEALDLSPMLAAIHGHVVYGQEQRFRLSATGAATAIVGYHLGANGLAPFVL